MSDLKIELHKSYYTKSGKLIKIGAVVSLGITNLSSRFEYLGYLGNDNHVYTEHGKSLSRIDTGAKDFERYKTEHWSAVPEDLWFDAAELPPDYKFPNS